MSAPSEFDLRPSERKLSCGCYVEEINGVWRITGQAFLCPDKHKFHAALAPELGGFGETASDGG